MKRPSFSHAATPIFGLDLQDCFQPQSSQGLCIPLWWKNSDILRPTPATPYPDLRHSTFPAIGTSNANVLGLALPHGGATVLRRSRFSCSARSACPVWDAKFNCSFLVQNTKPLCLWRSLENTLTPFAVYGIIMSIIYGAGNTVPDGRTIWNPCGGRSCGRYAPSRVG